MRILLVGRDLRVVVVATLLTAILLVPGGLAHADRYASRGSGPGQFFEPNGIAVNQSNGDVYIVDTGQNRVERFTSHGQFVSAWGWGVADGKRKVGALQTCTVLTGCFAGIKGAGAGQFDFAEGVAVDSDPRSASYGDVYVADISNFRIEKFSATGSFLLMFGTGVNVSAHRRHEAAAENVCPVKPRDRCGAGERGTAAGQLQFPVEGNFIVVGPGATVYVGGRNEVQEFSPDGRYLSRVSLLPQPQSRELEMGGVSRLAVDANGDLYAVRLGVSGVLEYSPRGELLQAFDLGEPQEPEGPTPGVTLGPEGRVFLDIHERNQHRLSEYGPAGVRLADFDIGMEDGLHGLAYSDVVHKLYIVNSGDPSKPLVEHVRIVTPPVTARPLAPALSGFRAFFWP